MKTWHKYVFRRENTKEFIIQENITVKVQLNITKKLNIESQKAQIFKYLLLKFKNNIVVKIKAK